MKKMTVLALLAMAAAPAIARPDYGPGPGGSIPDFVTPNPGVFMSNIVVTDSFAITDASIMINLSHTWAGDLIITLEKTGGGPTATILERVGRVGGTGAGDSSDFAASQTLTFANAGTNIWTTAAGLGSAVAIPTGTYAASGVNSGAANNAFSAFVGLNSAGTWRLRITDNAGLDLGSVASWKLTLVPTPGAVALFGLAGVAGLRRRRA